MQQMQSATTDPDAVAAALLEVVPQVMRTIRALMRSHSQRELSVPQFRALGYIQRHPGCSVSAVAEHVGLSVPAASRLVEGLVSQELIRRDPSIEDRRFVALHLAEPGKRLLEAARSYALEHLATTLATLDDVTRAGIVQAMEVLRVVYGAPPSHERTP
jgi:DNA-binding MarR family transcriptional regulator